LLDRLLSHLEVHVEHFALCVLSSGWRIRLPGPSKTMLHLVLRGRGAIRGPDGQSHAVAPGHLAIVPQGANHDLESEGKMAHELRVTGASEGDSAPRIIAGPEESSELVIACGLVQVRYGPSLGLFDLLPEIIYLDLSDSSLVMSAFKDILEEQAQPGPGSDAMTSALMTQCLVHILRRLYQESDCRPLPWLTALEDARLARALQKILNDPGADHTVESLAEAAAMSRSSFAERFVAAFGLSPMSFLHHLRMQRAARLLRQGGQSIDEVAGRVGFASRSHFSRAFKTHTGYPPAAFRKTPH